MADPVQPEPDTATLVRRLLDIRTWQAFDLDAEGRVLAGHDESGSVQLHEIDADGTRRVLTDLPSRVTGRYLPGRRAVLVQHDEGGDENLQLSLLDLGPDGPVLPAGLGDLRPVAQEPGVMHTLHDVTAEALLYGTNRRNRVDMDLLLRDLATGEERVVYDGGGLISAATLSPDAARVALTLPTLRPASTQVLVLDLADGGDGAPTPVELTGADEHAIHDHAAWAGDALVLSSNRDRDLRAVVRAEAGAGGTWDVLLADDTHDLYTWPSPDGAAMVVGTLRDGALDLALHDSDGTVRFPVPNPSLGMAAVTWAPDGSRFALTRTGPTEPGAIDVVDATTGSAHTVVTAAGAVPADLAAGLAVPEVHRVPTPDGESIPCFVLRPTGPAPDPATAGASVVFVHGGPEAASERIFSPVQQALAASGFTVLVPNVRGSTGYGKRWYSLDDVDLRLDSVEDLRALHAWLPDLGLDPARSALWGGSYGGYMVLAGLATQPDLWGAGVDIVGMSSLVTFLENTSPYRRAFREREYGSLEHDHDLLVRASPITYLDALRAPLFVIHGANDPRVPLSEAEQIHAALTGKGVPCELRVYDDEGHGLAKRANRLDAYPAALEFLRGHLGAPGR